MDCSAKQETLKTFTDVKKAPGSEQLLAKINESKLMANFSTVWNGSLSSLVSCDNLTDDLVSESMKELEKALCESQKLLSKRDKDILELRQALEHCKIEITTDIDKQEKLLRELEKSQKRIVELEGELTEQKKKDDYGKMDEKSLQKAINLTETSYTECTCYCGSVCNALREMNETKAKLEKTEHKYANLKRKIRERRKVEAEAQRHSTRMTVNERSPGCILQ